MYVCIFTVSQPLLPLRVADAVGIQRLDVLYDYVSVAVVCICKIWYYLECPRAKTLGRHHHAIMRQGCPLENRGEQVVRPAESWSAVQNKLGWFRHFDSD